jgi:hypothetical protein
MTFKKEKHEWSYRIQCEFCKAGFKDRSSDLKHKC